MKCTEIFQKIKGLAIRQWDYCARDVWNDSRSSWQINIVKTLNLSVRSFFNTDLQTRACALTYRTMLAIVPALALLLAIGKGFGLQNVLRDELLNLFPAQQQAVTYALHFVDSYLGQSSEGVFLGIGLIFLLWTLISLLGSIELTFNRIWGVKSGRGLGRKITDYTAALLILPIVMVCASGLSLMLNSTLRALFDFSILTPLHSWIIEISSWLFTCLFFALMYVLIPNTKVRFGNAFISGLFAGSGFLILQWLFVSGQMYVARYNAIYGSFSFLPLFLIWLQLTYVIMFAGAVVCYSSQNIFRYNFSDAISNMSASYYARIVVAVGAVVVQRFAKDKGATTVTYMVNNYNLPPMLVTMICDKLVAAGVFAVVELDSKEGINGFQPAREPSKLTIAEVYKCLDATGDKDFIPEFDNNFPGVVDKCKQIIDNEQSITTSMLLSDIKIKDI